VGRGRRCILQSLHEGIEIVVGPERLDGDAARVVADPAADAVRSSQTVDPRAEPHALHGELPVAYVVPKPGADLDAASLRDWCRERLGRHEVPRRILLREALPKNAAGKILKRELRRQGELDRGVDLPGGAQG